MDFILQAKVQWRGKSSPSIPRGIGSGKPQSDARLNQALEVSAELGKIARD